MAWNGLTLTKQLAASAPHGVERAHRDRLAAILRRFLDQSISAFEWDALLDEYGRSRDRVVRFVSVAVWPFYDDRVDHLVALSEWEWDDVQRLLLPLQSDGAVQSTVSDHDSMTPVIEWCGLVGYGGIIAQAGWGDRLPGFVSPFGFLSIGLAWFRRWITTKWFSPCRTIRFPFGSFSALASTYRAVSFKKTRYPRQLACRWNGSVVRNSPRHYRSIRSGWSFHRLCCYFKDFQFASWRTV